MLHCMCSTRGTTTRPTRRHPVHLAKMRTLLRFVPKGAHHVSNSTSHKACLVSPEHSRLSRCTHLNALISAARVAPIFPALLHGGVVVALVVITRRGVGAADRHAVALVLFKLLDHLAFFGCSVVPGGCYTQWLQQRGEHARKHVRKCACLIYNNGPGERGRDLSVETERGTRPLPSRQVRISHTRQQGTHHSREYCIYGDYISKP